LHAFLQDLDFVATLRIIPVAKGVVPLYDERSDPQTSTELARILTTFLTTFLFPSSRVTQENKLDELQMKPNESKTSYMSL